MTFKIRQIDLQFSGGGSTVSLKGLRCMALISNPGGFVSYGQLQLRVYGMTLAQMNQFSSIGTNLVADQNQSIIVSAGDEGGAISQVFSGTLMRSYIDFSNAPDVCFVCSGVAGYFDKANASAPNSYSGSTNAEDIISALATGAGYSFENKKGAHSVLQNQYLSGSVIDQMQTVAKAANFPMTVENGIVAIWPNDSTRDDVVISVSPENGMVGYPTYWEAGFTVTCEFNPQIINGRQINLTSNIPKANGTWPIQTVTHELSTLSPDGAWFSTVRLMPSVYVQNN